MKRLLLAILALTSLSYATVPVALAPVAKQQFFDSSGRVLSFGCVFTYQSGTTTPLASYTDSTGTVPATNPIILDVGGRAGSTGSTAFFIQAGVAYTVKVVSQGGSNCALGTTQYTIDGVGGGLTLTTTVASCTGTCPSVIAGQTQLFQITLTGNTTANPISAVGITPPATVYWEIIQDSGGAHSWTWPSNSVGGCTIASAPNSVTVQAFVWDGTNARATGPCVTGNGPAVNVGSILATGTITATQFISTIATGTAPLVVASTTQVANLNVSQLESATWEIPGTIGSTTPNTGAFSTLKVGGSAAQTSIQGGTTDVKLLSSSTVSATAGLPFCTDGAAGGSGATTTCTGAGPIFAPQRVTQGAGAVPIPANTQTMILTESVTFPSTGGTYRADVRYGTWITSGPNICGTLVVDTTNTRAFAFTQQNANGSGFNAYAASEISSQTYAAGATATFQLQAQCNAISSATQTNAAAFTYSPNPVTFLEVTPVLSN